MYAAACGQGQGLPLTQGAALHIFLETVHHSMPRTSPVFYIAPSAISITPNANGSADDLAVYVARGAKIRVYSPGCGIGTTDASFQEWSFAGRNRRLGDSAKEYTIYGRLSKTDRTKGYLVFAPKVGGLDKYPWVTLDGLATGTAGQPTGDYWYVRMGDVSLPVGGERTVTLDTGILGTDQFNTEWNLDPDDMPLRVQIAVAVDGQDAGPTPYVPWGSDAVLTASLVEGWDGDSHATVDRWEIVRNTGQDGDSSWPDAARKASFASTGRIDIRHSRQGGDDLAGAVSASFFVTCYGRTEEGGEVTAIASAGVTILAETQEKYELVLSSSVMGYSPITGEYTPSEGIAVRVRATDQKGDVTKIALARLEQVRLSAEYGVSGGDEWMPLEFTDGDDGSAIAMIPVTAFASQRNLDVRLLNQAGAEIHTATIAFVKDGEDSREREWIFLRSAEQITFGDDPEGEHPKPSVIAGGEVEPQGAASGDDTDKDQDGWVPEGWWDEPQGTDETLRYEYASYRDYIHEGDEEGPDGRVPGHWGEFTSPVVWSYRAEDGVSYRCRFMLGERETWQLVQAASGALYGDLPFTATLMRRRGNGQEEEMPEAPTVITVTFEGLDKTYVLDAVRPQLVVSETENPGMIQHLNDASLISMTVAFATGGETFQYNIPALRRADGETWWRWDPITDTIEFLKTISRAVIHNLNVTGVFDAIKGYIDDLRSHNYQSGLLDGSGFRLTADNGDGSSELEVDFLKVRKKATFMELEVREETFVGGNQHYSPAGSILYRVDYLDVNDGLLGYSVMKVPFLLKRFAFLGRVFNYAARKRVRRKMTDEEWKQCHHFRCYLLADDGTTATRNWWKVGDQAKCQTFNKAISAQNKRDNGYNWKKDHFNDDPSAPMPKYTTIEGPFETSYYWRLISNVGSEKLEDGHAYDFVDMPYECWDVTIGGRHYYYTDDEKASFRDGGSGIPVAGDTIVCMGNRTDEERMNMISLYTSGDDNNPPAIKGYRGIHTFKIKPENRVFEISPNEFLIRSRMFKLLDDSGYQFPVPLDRGEWKQGTRYHWYDRVSWKGSIWLCQVLDDEQWEDASGNRYEEWRVEDIEYGEGEFDYYIDGAVAGTDHYYKKGKVGSTVVYYVKRYTYSEPDRNNDLWLREVAKGTEITDVETAYAASKAGTEHPADDNDAWKTVGKDYATPAEAIAATGIDDPEHKNGVYLWTRTKTFYDDANDPDRPPTVEYTVVRWGIDADGIYQINSYYLSRLSETPIDASSDSYPMPGDTGWKEAAANAKWFDAFSACASANGGVGSMQGWMVWEKTVIIYDQHFDKDGKEDTKPDIITYKSSRIGQDGQIGMEEYYMLAESDDFKTVFGSLTPDYSKIGIRWYNQSNPAAENWRLSDTTPNIDTAMWKAVMPAYDRTTDGNKVYLWNFEQRTDGQGTEYATKPICIGNHARGIKGVRELYALSAYAYASDGESYPSDVKTGTAQEQKSDQHVWTDEKYDRSPSEALPYQWNWTRTLYSSPKDGGDTARDEETGYYYEDTYHVSAVRGTKGEDGSGTEHIFFQSATESYGTHPNDITKDKDGTQRDAAYIKSHDDFVPYGWTDNPQGISHDKPYEFVSERRSSATTGTGGFSGGHEWGAFSDPKPWSKWGYNGQDGDGTEYVFIRTKNNVAPVILASDGGTEAQYKSQEWRPYVDARDDIELNDYKTGSSKKYPRCTDDPKGTDDTYKFEWVAKRTMGSPSTATANLGHRDWKSYYECVEKGSGSSKTHNMSLWSNLAESSVRLDLSNEMDMVPTDDKGKTLEKRVVTTVARLFDGAKEIKLDPAKLWIEGGLTQNIKEEEGNGLKLTFNITKNFTIQGGALDIKVNYRYPNPDTGTIYSSVLTIAASMGQPIFQLSPSHSSLPCSRKADNTLNDPPALSLEVVKINGASSESQPATKANLEAFGVTVQYSTSGMPASSTDGSPWPDNNSVQASSSDTNVYIAMFNASGVLLDRETVPVIKDGKDGKNVARLDLSNEMDMVPTTSDRVVKMVRTVETVVRMFDGATEVDIRGVVFGSGGRISGGPAPKVAAFSESESTEGKGKKLSWTFNTGETMSNYYNITISYTHTDGVVYQAVFTVVASNDQAIYQLKPDMSSISFHRSADNTLSPASRDITLVVAKIDGNSSENVEYDKWGRNPHRLTVRYSMDSMPTSNEQGQGSVWNTASVSVPNTKDNLFIALFNMSGVLIDRETIPVIKDGEKGEKGNDSTVPGPQGDYELITYAISAYKTAAEGAPPDDCQADSDWKATAPVPSVFKPFVWKRSIMYDPSTRSTYGNYSYVRLTGDKGDAGSPGKTGLWYRYLGVWGVDVTSVTNTNTVGYYVRGKGNDRNFYMNVKDAGVENKTEPSASAEGWEVMNSVFEYFMTKVTFADSAYLGSFIFNGDWMISQTPASGSPSAKYEKFDPENPNTSTGSNFIPQYAVDGRTGQVYMHGAYIEGNVYATGTLRVVNSSGSGVVKINGDSNASSSNEKNVTILDASGLYSRGSEDGFRLAHNSSGVEFQRFHPATGSWQPFYAGRAMRVESRSKGSSAKSLYATDDFVLLNTSDGWWELPTGVQNGKILSLRNISGGTNTIKPAYGQRIRDTGGWHKPTDTGRAINNDERAELVFYNNDWYLNMIGT